MHKKRNEKTNAVPSMYTNTWGEKKFIKADTISRF